jgi:hypothetical protein
MASYRLLVDHYVGTQYLEAGSIVSDSGPGAVLPPNWIPTTACDPVDAQALTNFRNAGPPGNDAEPNKGLGPWWTGGRWAPVGPPVHYWKNGGVT